MRIFLMMLLCSGCVQQPAVLERGDASVGVELGFAGLLSRSNRESLPPLLLSSGRRLSEGGWSLRSGGYYDVEIVSDGSQELSLEGAEFFRAVWINEVVVEDLEIRPLALDSLEFDAEGVMKLSFVAIKPGRYELRVPGSRGAGQRVEITIQ